MDAIHAHISFPTEGCASFGWTSKTHLADISLNRNVNAELHNQLTYECSLWQKKSKFNARINLSCKIDRATKALSLDMFACFSQQPTSPNHQYHHEQKQSAATKEVASDNPGVQSWQGCECTGATIWKRRQTLNHAQEQGKVHMLTTACLAQDHRQQKKQERMQHHRDIVKWCCWSATPWMIVLHCIDRQFCSVLDILVFANDTLVFANVHSEVSRIVAADNYLCFFWVFLTSRAK